MSRLERGSRASCDRCDATQLITTAVFEHHLFGSRVGYGPGGHDDPWIECDGVVYCPECAMEEFDSQ